MIRVLVADDSPTARALLVAVLGSDPEIQIAGEAQDGVQAVEKTRVLRPDVVTMDIRMPGLDGFEATKEIMITAPTPIIIVTSSVVIENVETTMHTLRVGALAVVAKPGGPGSKGFDEACQQLIFNVKTLSQVKVVRHWRPTPPRQAANRLDASERSRLRIVAMAASTGGPAALHQILTNLPGDFAVPILVVQHITAGFTAGLADWLNKESDLRVKVAEEGEMPAGRCVYLAPDDRHLGLSCRGAIQLSAAAAVGGFRPSASFLFESVAKSYHGTAVGVILTGMGVDGVEGLRTLRHEGGLVLAQDEKSSVVFGMPGAAVAAGLAEQVLSIEAIAPRLMQLIAN